ncbi:unnamed protein product [Lepidochelys kempii]
MYGLNQEQDSATQRAPKSKQKDVLKLEQEGYIEPVLELEETDGLNERSKAFQDVLSRLNLEKHRSIKIRLRDVLEICPESIKNRIPEALGDLPWHFLRKVMALNGTARNTSIGHKAPAEEMGDYEEKLHIDGTFCFSDTEMKVSLQSLDVLCAVLLCSVSYSRRSC